MSVASHRRIAIGLFWLNPNVLFGVENAKAAVIFLTIVATEDPQFSLV